MGTLAAGREDHAHLVEGHAHLGPHAQAFWNGCSKSTVETMTLASASGNKGTSLPTVVKKHVSSDCQAYKPALTTVLLDLQVGCCANTFP